ncbi:1-deoxy-D-xylulose-5-phosphate synthase [Marinagarivorans cellulosilyticus]|uniref:1-deoxy-D-xylulose-5-phosphate synthase n=1 Tax=Marinagarivorans cellulosilyticus TaxID=2721545 RepID=A0AAN2BL18_9GAMM|nr:1-deoxy-D-xylulose-5-phosphate synthase [Marinagarivorans cellulosilyticus]BCD98550.1 1-deoxy-D-xylulose-5-phosphate synthase [Marinagarivorans cellulosilyticus]
MFDEIPSQRPDTPLLDTIQGAADVRALDEKLLPQLAKELRAFLLFTVGQSGGHFGAGLGVVELTIALHYVLNTPDDRVVWDVGHQTYPHKILTGRRDAMGSIRQHNGLSGFPKRSESHYDAFGVGHSSTSISAALGMALGAQMAGREQKAVAVIGDGAMTAGMAFEALNHAAHTKADLLVVLNDNNMSISPNVGGLATYFSKIWASKAYTSFREGGKKVLKRLPQASELVRKTEEHMKGMVSPGTLFEELGFYYVGPIDGHDLPRLTHDLKNLSEIPGPKLLHIITQKGKGFTPAEKDPVGYHALNKIEPKPEKPQQKRLKYQDVFGQWLCDTASQDPSLVGITPAMCEGSGMVEFSERFTDRYFDVAIAEQHAVTLAAGMACEGQKPVVAIYSTFLQRAYDQLVHDVAIQKLDVTFAIDRAGLVGEDGPTHGGNFDISYLNCIPELTIATPSDENECYQLLNTSYAFKGPSAVRYPRGTGLGVAIDKTAADLPIGTSRAILTGASVCILNFGVLLPSAQAVAQKHGFSVIDMRWVKPLDTSAILKAAQQHSLIVTLEENTIQGGAGSAVNQVLIQNSITTPTLNLGLPDSYIEHAKRSEQLAQIGLDIEGIEASIQRRLQSLHATPAA